MSLIVLASILRYSGSSIHISAILRPKRWPIGGTTSVQNCTEAGKESVTPLRKGSDSRNAASAVEVQKREAGCRRVTARALLSNYQMPTTTLYKTEHLESPMSNIVQGCQTQVKDERSLIS
jgi:hypothetical protein